MPPSSPTFFPAASVGQYRWTVCALLFAATSINYVDRQILSLLKPILDDQFHWTNAEFGRINAAFQGAYAVSVLGFGWFIDRFGPKLGYALSITAWSIAALSHAFVGSAGGFFAARIALGLGEGGNFPAAVKSITLWFPKAERAFATSLFNSGANVGAVIAPATVPWIAGAFGWQATFVIASAIGLLWLVFWIPFFNVPKQQKRLSSRELAFIQADAAADPVTASIPWTRLLTYRQTWSFILAKFLTDPIWWFFLIWLPDYFHRVRDLNLKGSWFYLVTIYAIVTVLGIAGGWLTGHLIKRGWSVTRARKTGLFIFALAVLPILAVRYSDNWGAVLLIGLAGAAHQAWSANLYTTVSDMFPPTAVASIIGLGTTAGSIGGILFPLYCGYLLDRLPLAGYSILFTICACAYLLAFGIQHFLAPRFVQISTAGGP